MHDIKQIAPKKNSRFKQGYVNTSSCHKLFESVSHQPVIYRSSWELRFIRWCENSPKVAHWGSECVSIRYFLPTDQQWHTYYPDFLVEMTDGTKAIVEIKPANQVKKPSSTDTWAAATYIKNMSKWRTIKQACIEKGYKFCILTEHTIERL